jgi:steroid delta-isomerase-like uncharacterized protein
MFEQNLAAVDRLLKEAWGEGNLDVIDELVADDYVDHDPIGGDGDTAALKERITAFRAAFPDLSVTVDDMFTADDKVATRWTAEGTFENEFMGQEPTGEEGEPISGIVIGRFEGDLLAETWGQWDTLRFMKNLGALPEAAATMAR